MQIRLLPYGIRPAPLDPVLQALGQREVEVPQHLAEQHAHLRVREAADRAWYGQPRGGFLQGVSERTYFLPMQTRGPCPNGTTASSRSRANRGSSLPPPPPSHRSGMKSLGRWKRSGWLWIAKMGLSAMVCLLMFLSKPAKFTGPVKAPGRFQKKREKKTLFFGGGGLDCCLRQEA